MSYGGESSSVQPTPALTLCRVSARRLAANRRNALKSTRPRSKAGKYRSALNVRRKGWCPEALERELLARGEDPREFCCLHRDLAAIFRPSDAAASTPRRRWLDDAIQRIMALNGAKEGKRENEPKRSHAY